MVVAPRPVLVSQREGPLPGGLNRWARSRGVGVIFRVYTTSGSASLVERIGYDLSPLDVVLAVFPEVA